MYLRATATYTDGHGSGKMESAWWTTAAVGVTMDNEGSVSIFPRQSVVGRVLTASLSDADTPTDMVEPGSGPAPTPWTAPLPTLMGATAVSYTPVEGDVGMYLKATASYNDRVRQQVRTA